MNVASRLSMSEETERTDRRLKTRRGNFGDYEEVLKKIEEDEAARKSLQRLHERKVPKQSNHNDFFPSSYAQPWFVENSNPEKQLEGRRVTRTTSFSKRKERFAKLASSVACVGRVAGLSKGETDSRDDAEDSRFKVDIVEYMQWMEPKPKRAGRRVRFAIDEKDDKKGHDLSEEQPLTSDFDMNLPNMAEDSLNSVLAYLDWDSDQWLVHGEESFDTQFSFGDYTNDSAWTSY